jgi:hypothetical protein
MYTAGKFSAIHAKVNLFLNIGTITDPASPFTGPLLVRIFRSTAKAGFLI